MWAQNNPVTAFPVVYLGWAYLFWMPVLLSQGPVWRLPNLLWFLAGGASPLLAGILLAAIAAARDRVADLFRRLVDWRRISFMWWLVILSFWLLFDLATAGAALIIGVSPSPLDVHWTLLQDVAALLLLSLLSFVFPAVEETGLRGYYPDALQRRLPSVAAAVVNGLVWATWHAPFVWFPEYYAHTTFQPALSW